MLIGEQNTGHRIGVQSSKLSLYAMAPNIDNQMDSPHFASMSQTLELKPQWGAVGWVVTQNTRDVIERP